MRTLQPILFLALFLSCNSKKKEKTEPVSLFPVNSYINSQVAHVDTSLYSIIRILKNDNGIDDTTHHRREEFRALAKDFLDMPDLTDSDFEGRYTKDPIYDQTMNRVIITMLPVDPENEEIQRQEVVIRPDPSGDKVTSIIIDWVRSNRDSAVQKKMLWQVDESFQVTTIKKLKAQPETITTYRVVWNEPEPEYVPEEEKIEIQ
jgi:hypothetical protein